jgi:hypothetical protein
MNNAIAKSYNSIAADVISGGLWLPPAIHSSAPHVAEIKEELMLRIDVPGFEMYFGTMISNMHLADNYSVVTIESQLEPGVSMLITLRTQVVDDAGNLQIKEVFINFDVTEHRPRAHFLAASLYAMLPLAGFIRVEIPSMKVDVTVKFITPLREISTLLQSRQTHYGLMVIERASNLLFQIPEHISADDMSSISFSYHAIVENTFEWPANFAEPLPVPATNEGLMWLKNLQPKEPEGSIYKLQFGPEPIPKSIFGQNIDLGVGMAFINDAVILNKEAALQELLKLDGHIVPVLIRSLGGIITYHLPFAPRLPDNPWDEKMEACIKLEEKLNEYLADRYNDLAVSTLAGLTAEEIRTVTDRPVLSEDAHLIKEQE